MHAATSNGRIGLASLALACVENVRLGSICEVNTQAKKVRLLSRFGHSGFPSRCDAARSSSSNKPLTHEFTAPVALGEQYGRQIAMADAGVGLRRHDGFGVIGHAKARIGDHGQIVGAVAEAKGFGR